MSENETEAHRWEQFLAAVRREIPSWETAVTDARSEVARLRASLQAAEAERDAFTATYHAVNEVLLSGSTQRIDPTAERVQVNLTRLMDRAERCERDERAALARAEAAERSLAAAVEVLRQVEWRMRYQSGMVDRWYCPVCGGYRDDGHNENCALAAVISGGGR